MRLLEEQALEQDAISYIYIVIWSLVQANNIKQGVALTGRNSTGPPCSIGRPTPHAPGHAAADRPRTRRPARQPAGSVTDDDRRQTLASKTILAH